nr:carboxypeptidase regulatory-like domain-containing protein [Pseudomonadota bacterium]
MRTNLLLGVAAVALIIPAAASAQETTATIQGVVTSADAPVAGATIVITHVPSGTVSRTTTKADGGFSASGLRVGGPYTVNVSSSAGDTSVGDVYTVVGQAFTLPIDIAPATKDIVVTATRVRGAGSISEGPATVLNAAQISKVASVNRDIRDLMRRDPFANLDTSQGATSRQVSFAGVNPRFNRFTVDGVPITDSFGLNSDGLPSRRGPVPLDSIAQFETKVAPFDIREGFFEGGVTNAILKSGTNEFHGTGFYTYSSDKLTGDRTKAYIGTTADGQVKVAPFKSRDFGAEISGPIIKDRLFFMISGERVRASLPLYSNSFTAGGIPIANLSDADFARIQNDASTIYGVTPGGILRSNGDKDDRLVGKLDANISDTQRLSLTGFYTKDSINSINKSGTTDLSTLSDDYIKPNRVVGGVLQLNSDWSSNISTEVRLRYKDYQSGQTPFTGGIAFATICTDPVNTGAATSCSPNTPSVYIGPPGSASANVLHVKTYGGSFLTRATFGSHTVRFLTEYENSKNYDLFLATTVSGAGSSGPYGAYYFDSIAAFEARTAQAFGLSNATTLVQGDAAAKFDYQTYTFGLQDEWRIAPNLHLSYGLRYDLYGGHSRPLLNTNFFAREGFANTSYISGRSLLQPRIGFDYTPIPRVTIHGGAGIFGGGTPDVYIANSFSASGVQPASITGGQCPTALTNVSLTSVPAACNAALSNTSSTANGSVSALDPHFRIPSQWRGTLSGSWNANLGPLGDNWHFGADVLYSKVRDAIFVRDGRLVPITGANALTPDGRQRYSDVVCNNNTTSCVVNGSAESGADYLLGNTSRGRTWVAVAHFDKKWDFGLGLNGSFTYQDARDLQALPSSVAASNYGNSAYFDPNGGAYGHTNDEVKYQFKYDVSYEHAFFRDYKTRIDLFGETRIGSPYSYVFQDTTPGRSSVFGSVGTNSRYLFYVPTGINDPKAVYADAATQNTVEALINSTDLKKYRGQVAPRNAFHAPWFTRLDIHLEQEIPTFIGHSRISVFADIENLTNLINHNWGQQLRANFPYNKQVVQVSCVPAGASTCDHYSYANASSPATQADQLIT